MKLKREPKSKNWVQMNPSVKCDLDVTNTSSVKNNKPEVDDETIILSYDNDFVTDDRSDTVEVHPENLEVKNEKKPENSVVEIPKPKMSSKSERQAQITFKCPICKSHFYFNSFYLFQ